MNGYQVAWLVLGVAALIVEVMAAINNRPNDTLSEQVWSWLGFGKTKGPMLLLRWGILVMLWVAGALHFFFRIS